MVCGLEEEGGGRGGRGEGGIVSYATCTSGAILLYGTIVDLFLLFNCSFQQHVVHCPQKYHLGNGGSL